MTNHPTLPEGLVAYYNCGAEIKELTKGEKKKAPTLSRCDIFMDERATWAADQERKRVWHKNIEGDLGLTLSDRDRRYLDEESRAIRRYTRAKRSMERYPHYPIARLLGIPLPGSCPTCEGRGIIREEIPNPPLGSDWGNNQGFQYFSFGELVPCPEKGCTVNGDKKIKQNEEQK